MIGECSRTEDLSAAFEENDVAYHPVSIVNWEDYPYKPNVSFGIAHDGKNIYINWKVDEAEIKALCGKDGGDVWKDSCVEFFVTFDNSSYYNIETNCIGKVLAATGSARHSRASVPAHLIANTKRCSSLGDKPLERGSGKWELSLIIPADLFYLDSITSLSGIKAEGNFYKCGDDLGQIHFLSWNAIDSETPDFHLPPFFGELYFE